MGFVVDTSVLIAAERGRVDFSGLLDSCRIDVPGLSAISASEFLHGLHRAQTPTIARRRKMFVELASVHRFGHRLKPVSDSRNPLQRVGRASSALQRNLS